MTYTIIEDCSPYYIRFTHPDIAKFIRIAQGVYNATKEWKRVINDVDPLFANYQLHSDAGEKLLKINEVHNNLLLRKDRVSYFVSQPGLRFRAHQDGLMEKFGINYPIKLLDDTSETCWYNDNEINNNYKIYEYTNKNERAALEFDKTRHTPLATLKYRPNEAVLINTAIFHDFDNSRSENERIILTLRSGELDPGNIYFDDARKQLFGI